MKQIALVGKTTVDHVEAEMLSAIGMCIALSGARLVTTPTGGAAAAAAEGFRAAAGGEPHLTTKPLNNKPSRVIFYDDGDMRQALFERDPSPITETWTILLTPIDLINLAEGAIYALEERGISVS